MRSRALFGVSFLVLMALAPHAHADRSPARRTAVPTANSWKLSFSDNFNGHHINQNVWSLYGKAGPEPPACRDSKNVVVGGGTVDLKVKSISGCLGFSASGMCACAKTTQTYGKYEVRLKAEAGDSKVTFLLWGANDWPPEIDFLEFPTTPDGAARQTYNQTLHYSSSNQQIHSSIDSDMTKWHTVGLEWSPGLINYTLDGVSKITITSHVPAVQMWMGLQTAGTDPPSSTIDAWIDWVHVYTYVGG